MPFTDARRLVGRIAGRAAALCVVAVLAGCGAPPQPLPTSPPRAPTVSGAPPSAGPSGAAPFTLPPGAAPGAATPGYPGYPATGYPATGYPATGYPATGYPAPGYPATYPAPGYTPPTYSPPAVRTTTPPTTTRPPAAPRCRTAPTAAQVLAVVRNRPGVPRGAQLRVAAGPYCAGQWHYSAVDLVGDPDAEPLLVVTRGNPLVLVEAGGDVCSDRVQTEAPPGIRVLACGS